MYGCYTIAHVGVIIEGPKIWYELFLQDMEKQQYTYKATHGQIGIIGPMIRELHFLDITVPEQCLPELFADLAPYVRPTTKQKTMALFIRKAIWFAGKFSSFFKGTTLHPIPDVKSSGNIRRKALNIMALAWFEDGVCTDGGLVLPKKGKGGELL